MSGTSRIDWRVPAEEWERFITFVDEERVANDRYIRQYVELAMEEWVDSDGGAALEERVDRVIRAAGRTPDAHTEKKDTSSAGLSSNALANQEKVRVTRKVFAEVHAKFDAYVEEHSDNNAGVELG